MYGVDLKKPAGTESGEGRRGSGGGFSLFASTISSTHHIEVSNGSKCELVSFFWIAITVLLLTGL